MFPSVKQDGYVSSRHQSNRFQNAGAAIMNNNAQGQSGLSFFGISQDNSNDPPRMENLMKMLNPPQNMRFNPPRRGNNRSVSVVPPEYHNDTIGRGGDFTPNNGYIPTNAYNNQASDGRRTPIGGFGTTLTNQPSINHFDNTGTQYFQLPQKQTYQAGLPPPKQSQMPQMGFKSSPAKSPPKAKGKSVAPVNPEGDLYNIQQMNANIHQSMLEEGEDAGGAIMKKLYRIHSRYVLETTENMRIDISGQLVDAKNRRGGPAMPLDQKREYGKKKRMVDPNNHLLSLFLNKNHIGDFETVIDNQMDRINQVRNYDEQCYLLHQCFRDNLDKKIDKKKVVQVSVVNLMKYHDFFAKLSSQAVKLMMKNWHLIKLSQDQLLYKEQDTPLGFYMVIFGKVVMHSKNLGAIGMVSCGDFIGEELLFEKSSNNNSLSSQAEKPQHLRAETAYSEGDTYLLECYFDEWPKLKDMLILMKLRNDYILTDKHLKHCYFKKKAWRQIKSKITGQIYSIDDKPKPKPKKWKVENEEPIASKDSPTIQTPKEYIDPHDPLPTVNTQQVKLLKQEQQNSTNPNNQSNVPQQNLGAPQSKPSIQLQPALRHQDSLHQHQPTLLPQVQTLSQEPQKNAKQSNYETLAASKNNLITFMDETKSKAGSINHQDSNRQNNRSITGLYATGENNGLKNSIAAAGGVNRVMMTEMGGHDHDMDDMVRLNQSRESIIRQVRGGSMLDITLVEGHLFRDTEMFGAMDPFITIKYKGQEYKTRAIDGGGKNPKWNETLSIPIDSVDDSITLICFDDDGNSNDLVGQETFKISLLLTKTATGASQFALNYDNKKSADVIISAKLGQHAQDSMKQLQMSKQTK